jgi:hypothetical protein
MINHSQIEPNVRPLVVWEGDEAHVVFVARNFIPANTELKYTYHIKDRNYQSEFAWYSS